MIDIASAMKFVPASGPSSNADWSNGFGSSFAWFTPEAQLLLILLVVIGFFVFAFSKHLRDRRRKQSRHSKSTWRNSKFRNKSKPNIQVFPSDSGNMADPTNQMQAIAKVQFERSRLLNKEEARLLPILESIAQHANSGYRVMAQTSLGEILRPRAGSGSASELKNAFASINSKRLDFAIFDKAGFMVCAVEYQGSGHYQGNAFMRDTVKREVLRRAGVPLIEVPKSFESSDVKRSVARILHPETRDSQHRHTTVHV